MKMLSLWLRSTANIHQREIYCKRGGHVVPALSDRLRTVCRCRYPRTRSCRTVPGKPQMGRGSKQGGALKQRADQMILDSSDIYSCAVGGKTVLRYIVTRQFAQIICHNTCDAQAPSSSPSSHSSPSKLVSSLTLLSLYLSSPFSHPVAACTRTIRSASPALARKIVFKPPT